MTGTYVNKTIYDLESPEKINADDLILVGHADGSGLFATKAVNLASFGPTGATGPVGPTGPTGSLNSQIAFGGILTPSSLSVNTNNYSPTGLSTCNFLRLSAITNVIMTGIVAPSPVVNQFILVVNLGPGNITLLNNNPGSSVGNHFINNNDLSLNANESVILMYDSVSLGWRIFGVQN